MHKHPPAPPQDNNPEQPPAAPSLEEKMQVPVPPGRPGAGVVGRDGLQELMEKNLKWSQILYEQNRRINSKLFWMAIGSWIRLLLIIVPLVLGILYLPSFLKRYSCLWGGTCPPASSESIENILKLLPLSPEQQEQFEALLK